MNKHYYPIIRYVEVVLLLATIGFALSEAKTTNEITNFGKILATIRTDTWMDVNVTGEIKNTSVCLNDVATVWKSATAGHMWALHMLDAESKVQSGILLGNLRNLGMYEQCVEIAAQHNPTNIRSQYCMVSLTIPPNLFSDASNLLLTNKLSGLGECAGSALSLTSAMCLPSSCSENDIFGIVSEIIEQNTELEMSHIEVAQVKCSRPRDGRFTVGEYLFMAFITISVSFLLYCTACDFIIRGKGIGSSRSMKTLAKFSLYTNAVSTLSTKTTPDTIPGLDGLRILGMIYMIAFHLILNTIVSPIINMQSLLKWQYDLIATFFFMGSFIIDTFFIISSFLLIHNLLKSIRSGKKFSVLENCINRYVRLTPAVIVVILIAIFYVHRLGSGPVWGFAEDYIVGYCMENWWTNLLHIQNIVHAEHMCLPHLWYLAAEMQLFFATQVLLFVLFRWPKYQKSIFISVIVGSLIVPPMLFAINGYTNAFFKITPEMGLPKLRDNLIYGYGGTIHRSFPYLAGAVLGYLTVNNKIKVTKFQAKIYWLLTSWLVLLCFAATRYLYLESYKYNMVFEVTYSALTRPAWVFVIVWIIYACMHGHGGSFAKFLSAPVFSPLSRISYCTFIVHFMLQSSMGAGVQVPIFQSKFAMLHHFWGDLFISSALGFLLSLFFETPIRILEKTLKNWNSSQSSTTQKSSEIILEENIDRKAKKIG